MPFDDPTKRVEIEVPHLEEIAILDGMARRLATPDLWCKRVLCENGRHCILGALNEEDHGHYTYRWSETNMAGGLREVLFARAAARAVALRLADLVGDQQAHRYVQRTAVFNNAPNTTHRDILGLIRRARASFE